MNPYAYSDPPHSYELLESPTKLKSTVWFDNGNLSNTSRKKTVYLIFCFGLCLGFFITSFIKDYVFPLNLCIDNSYSMQRKVQPMLPTTQEFENVRKKNLIFIGVMTANKYLNTRAKAIYETWGKNIPGDIAFFSSEVSSTDELIPLIKLKGVDDSYPPQKKSFMMIKYMYDNYINDYEYFMRADDDVYIRTDRLEKFLKSINSSKLYYIGQAGRGNQDEFGHLALNNKENFCMGGPGMIFSRATLEKMAPNIKSCVKNLRSLHEDVEIGRCVQKFAGIPCTWSYEMQNIFYHNNSDSKAFTGSLNQKEVHRAITLHPVKNHFHMNRLHAYIKSLMLKEKEYETIQAVREMRRFCDEFKLKIPALDDHKNGIFISHLGMETTLRKWKPKREEESMEWDFFQRNAYQVKDGNPRHRMTSYMNSSLADVIRDVMETINRLSKERGRVIDFKEILYGYKRLNPSFASEYILDMLLVFKKYRGKKMTVPVRRHAYVHVPFGPLYIQEVEERSRLMEEQDESARSLSDVAKIVLQKNFLELANWYKDTEKSPQPKVQRTKRIHFILPLSGRFSTFQRFIDDFRKVCLERSEEVVLVVVSFRPQIGSEDTRQKVEDVIEDLQKRFPDTMLSVVRSNSTFARAPALELGASMCGSGDLLFFIDVDMTFTSSTLQNIRTHTIRGKQVYYPVVFSEFDPNILDRKINASNYDHLVIDEEIGYWRAFGFGIVSLYKSDLRRVGGFDTSILGWGKEDVDLFDKVIKEKSLTIFRAPDPGLVHVFHRVECDPKLEPSQLVMCEGSLYSTYAALPTLTKTLRTKPEILMFKRTLS